MGGLKTPEEAYRKTEPKLEIAGQTLQCRNEASPVMRKKNTLTVNWKLNSGKEVLETAERQSKR